MPEKALPHHLHILPSTGLWPPLRGAAVLATGLIKSSIKDLLNVGTEIHICLVK